MESSKNIIGQDAQAKKLSRSKSTSNKVKNNKPSSIVTSNLSNISKSKVDKPKSPILSKDVSSSRNVERKKSISGAPSTISPLNRNKSVQSISTTMTRKQKVGTSSSNVSASDESGPNNLLDRRPSAPPKLNLAFKNHRSVAASQQTSPNDSSSKNSLGKVSPSVAISPPLMSPKIRELRKSEPFQAKPSGKETSYDDSSTVSSSRVNKNNKNKLSPFTSKSRRVPAKNLAIKKPSVLSSLPKAELNKELLARLEHQNSQLPPQDSTQFLLARLERQNDMLDNDPKSVCIESNVLKANLEVVQSLIDDITSPLADASGSEDPSSSPSTTKKHRDSNDEETKKIDWDFWTALIQDYAAVATKLPHLLSAKLQQGLPMKLRGLIWQSMSQASSTYLETMYSQLLSESSPYDRIIQRDLARTFPTVEMFKEENGRGQTMLWNVLKAYSLYDPLVGYCQGLGFLVGPLLMNMSEAQAFCVFVRLMETYDMRTMFTLSMEGLQLRLYQFSCLLLQIIPSLHSHFRLHGIHEAMFASQWFLSLFAYTYPLPLVFRIYDVVFAEGAPETIMRVAIALLKKNEEKLLELGEFEELLDFLTSRLYDTYNNEPTGLIQDAMELSSVITKSKLDQLSDNYVNDIEDQKKRTEELVSVRFNGRFGRSKKDKKKDESKREKRSGDGKSKRWSFNAASLPNSRHSIATMQNLIRSSSTSSDISTSSDNETPIPKTPLTPSCFSSSASIGVLHQQIEDLVTALSHLQKEHADMTDQLVNIKMEKMDLVNEVEGLNNRLRGLEKENKRTSTSSMVSVDSSMTLSNDEGFDSGRTTRIASPITPNPDQKSGYDHVKNLVHYIGSKLDLSENEILKMRRSSAPAISLTESQLSLILNNNNATDSTSVVSKDKTFGLTGEWNDESKKQNALELALTEELIQVKREKFDLMLENRELVKRNSELENALENSHQLQKSSQDKNTFLSKEIERLDEEAAQALYEQNSMREEIKAVKPLRIEHIRANRENEKLKQELENVETRLRQYEPEYVGNNDWVISMEEIDEIISSTTPKSSRRVSFLNFFGATTPTGSNGGFIFPSCTIESCTSTKKCDDLEKMLKHVKKLLVESEAARGQLSSHIDDLNSMINGFDNLYDDDIFQSVGESENSFQNKPKSEKRLSTSLAAFFGAA
ncbi:290_t:CDS:2 [Funneliformis mosseae]|uniref:290_t:CDS:1 n=1 Tax=Funneliformis mosseae TaxID=27381 RepID=A0A9N8VU76_FUNMO|nr:290_t:CDS:2 [Funneliformis mosseae]